MRSAALASIVLALGVFAGVALAAGLPGPVPTPTVPAPTPTVHLPPPPVPVLPVPTLPTPSLPIASPPVRVSTPSTPSVSQPASAAPLAGVGSTSSSASGGSGTSGSSPTAGYRPAHRSSLSGLHSSRPWISTGGPKSRRTTILSFRLRRKARVSFTVMQVSPVCAVAGRFVVRGHAGLNRVRFNGKLKGKQLSPGTYRINARSRSGAAVLHVIVVIVGAGVPSPSELRAARRSNVCGAAAPTGPPATTSGFTAVSRTLNRPRKSSIVRHQNPSATGTGPHGHRSAAPFTPARISQNAANPLVVAAFALALVLLGLAALPQRAVPDPRLNDMLARHRVEVALAGAAALAAALLALALA